MNTPNLFVCPSCLFRSMRVALDRKGRAYFHCTGCSARLFLHSGPIGAHAVANTLRILDNPAVLEAVRRASFQDAEKGQGQGLHALLGINTGGVTTSAPAENTELRKVG
jgi:hypothetical protein